MNRLWHRVIRTPAAATKTYRQNKKVSFLHPWVVFPNWSGSWYLLSLFFPAQLGITTLDLIKFYAVQHDGTKTWAPLSWITKDWARPKMVASMGRDKRGYLQHSCEGGCPKALWHIFWEPVPKLLITWSSDHGRNFHGRSQIFDRWEWKILTPDRLVSKAVWMRRSDSY